MACRKAATLSNNWSEHLLAVGYRLLFKYGQNQLPDADEVFAGLKRFVDDMDSEYFVTAASITLGQSSQVQDPVARQAVDPAVILKFEFQGAVLTFSITSDGYSAYTESFQGAVPSSGPLRLGTPSQLHALVDAFLGVGDPAVCTDPATGIVEGGTGTGGSGAKHHKHGTVVPC